MTEPTHPSSVLPFLRRCLSWLDREARLDAAACHHGELRQPAHDPVRTAGDAGALPATPLQARRLKLLYRRLLTQHCAPLTYSGGA